MRFCLSVVLGLMLTCRVNAAEPAEFQACLAQLQGQASARELSADTVSKVIPSLEYQARVIELDRSQPEFTQTFADY